MLPAKLIETLLVRVEDDTGFETFCNDLMQREGYQGIEPLGGTNDKGRDALHISKSSGKITIFAYSLNKRWETKLRHDLNRIREEGHKCNEVVFVSNSNITPAKRDKWKATAKDEYGWELELYGLKRIITIINTDNGLIQLHPSIFPIPDISSISSTAVQPLNETEYGQYVQHQFEEWQKRYTPLFAQQRELEIFAETRDLTGNYQATPVLRLGASSQPVILLGESGSGKTTALWRLALEESGRILSGENSRLPVLIRLRDWLPASTIRSLVQNEFARTNASNEAIEDILRKGNCLILIDGINELPGSPDLRDAARRDLQNFIKKYPRNNLVFTCRTPDYEHHFLEFEKDKEPLVYEIKRLERGQVKEYIERFFYEKPEQAADLLVKLDINNGFLWNDEKSFLNLIRIPIYLQLVIVYYQQYGEIPDNKAKLLKGFVGELIRREATLTTLTESTLSLILGLLAYTGLRRGYYLAWTEAVARQMVGAIIQQLQTDKLLLDSITSEKVWDQIISQNFLSPTIRKLGDTYVEVVEWLHQLLFDYFLAYQITQLIIDNDASEVKTLQDLMALQPTLMGQPLYISIQFLDDELKATLLDILLNLEFQSDFSTDRSTLPEIVGHVATPDVVERVYKAAVAKDSWSITYLRNLSLLLNARFGEEKKAQLLSCVLTKTLNIPNWDSSYVEDFLYSFAHDYLFDQVISTFRSSNTDQQERLAEVVSNAIVRMPTLDGHKRISQILTAWIRNRSEVVRFFSARALYPYDPGNAATTLRALHVNGSPRVKEMVQELMDVWSIE